MRVALVVERFEPLGGGVEGVAWNVAHGLAEAGDEVQVIARRASGSQHVPVAIVPALDAWQPLRVLQFSRRAARAAPRGAYDVVHSFSRTRHQDVYRAGGGCHAEYLRRSHGPTGEWLRRASPRHGVLLGIERRVFADASQVVQCASRRARDEIAAWHGVAAERFRIIPNAVDTRRFRPEDASARRKLRAELGAADDPLWLFAGSGWRRKGLDTALRALTACADPGHLWVVGRDPAGPWRALASRLGVADRVRFLGPRDDLERIYPACDGLLLPTRYDAFANVCLEAAAAGIPVVTSAANGAAEWLPGAAVVVERADDAPSFAAALARLGDPGERRPLGERGREIAEGLRWEDHVSALRAMYGALR